MTTPSTPDPTPSAALAGIRERNEHMRTRYGNVGGLLALAGAKEDVPRLIKAVEAALGCHVEAVVGEMPEPGLSYCATCSGHPAWPCPEVRAITTALTGEEGEHEQA